MRSTVQCTSSCAYTRTVRSGWASLLWQALARGEASSQGSYLLNVESSQATSFDFMPGNICDCSFVLSAGLQDVPEDPTGELDKVQKFVMENLDICKWVSLAVVLLEVSVTQTLAILICPFIILVSLFAHWCEKYIDELGIVIICSVFCVIVHVFSFYYAIIVSNVCRFLTIVDKPWHLMCGLQVLGLFFAFILRAISSSGRRDYDSDEDYMVPRSAPRRPAGNLQANQTNPTSGSGGAAAATETRPPRTDAWSTRMREKVSSYCI